MQKKRWHQSKLKSLQVEKKINKMSRCVRFNSRVALVLGSGGSCATSEGAGGLNSQEGEARSPLWPFSMMLLPGKQVGGQRGHSNSGRPLYHEQVSERASANGMGGVRWVCTRARMTVCGWLMVYERGWRCVADMEMWATEVICLLRCAACLHSFCNQVGKKINIFIYVH